MPLSNEEKQRYLDCYNPEFHESEGSLFNRLTGTRPSVKDIVIIYKWKTGRVQYAGEIKQNIENIKNAIEIAGNAGSEIKAIESLIEIKGIGLAVASAILSVYLPEKFTIIDYRVLEVLNYIDRPKTSDWDAQLYWTEFVQKVREFAETNNIDLRTADKILWGKSVSDQIDREIHAPSGVSS